MQTVRTHVTSLDESTLQAHDKAHVLVPWRAQGGERGPLINRAEGVYFWDTSGRRYLDFTSQFAFSNFGHGERRVVQAIQQQVDMLPVIASQFVTASRSEAAYLLSQVAPGDLNRVFFSTSGADANEAAIKMARDLTGRPLICSRYRSYHGSTYGSMTLSRDPRSWAFEPGIPSVIYAPICDPYRCRYTPPGGRCEDCGEHCAKNLEEVLLQHGPDRVAGVILEPIVGANGIIVPADGYLQQVRSICDRYGILLIADEVMTGFGRTGRWFACEHWDVVPDIMTVAKGMTGGYVPMAATIVREPLAQHWDDHRFVHGHTYSGHALGCAATVASIHVYQENDLILRAAKLGEDLLNGARDLMDRHPSVGDVRGKGLFVGMELVRNRQTKEPFVNPSRLESGSTAKNRVLTRCMEEGVYIMAGQASVIMLCPPLTITREQIDEALSVLDRALNLSDVEVDQ
jgi:taurine---2-oxoglutarate transaminase